MMKYHGLLKKIINNQLKHLPEYMGQYYEPVNLDKQETLSSHDYDNGLKLMEHSWVGNNFVGTIESLLAVGGAWHKNRIVWMGDYSDTTKKLHEDGVALKRIKPLESTQHYPYVVNHTKKQFIDKEKVPNSTWGKVHPLPLLTSCGNGRGGGDFRGKDPNGLIGSWAGDQISVSEVKPDKDYLQIVFDLAE